MTRPLDITPTIIVNSGAQEQAMNIARSRSSAVFSALVGRSQGDRSWIIDLQKDPPVWIDAAQNELSIESKGELQHWYDGYRAGLRLARLDHLGWWWHCEVAPPQETEDVLLMPELTRLSTQRGWSVPPPDGGDSPSFLLLLTWLENGEMRFRALEVDWTTQQLRDLTVLL